MQKMVTNIPKIGAIGPADRARRSFTPMLLVTTPQRLPTGMDKEGQTMMRNPRTAGFAARMLMLARDVFEVSVAIRYHAPWA